MRVGVYYNNHDVRLEEQPLPEIGAGELLVRVMASGICGSDVMEWYRLPKAPLVLGHEIAGEIVAVEDGVSQYQVGQRIAAFHHVPCNTCHYCRNDHHTVCDTFRGTHFDPGGFAEYVRVRAINVERGIYPLPDTVPFEEGAFVEPLACGVRGLRLARLRPGQSVLVIGSGIAGLLQVQLARAMGAGCIAATDIVPFRLEAARRLGADLTCHAREDVPAHLRAANDDRLADLVIVCTGALPALAQACRCVERGGTVLLFAPPPPGADAALPLNYLWTNEVAITTCYSGSPADAATAAGLIFRRRIDVRPMITHRLGLAEIGEGFRLVSEAQDSIKVMIEPWR